MNAEGTNQPSLLWSFKTLSPGGLIVIIAFTKIDGRLSRKYEIWSHMRILEFYQFGRLALKPEEC